jgi:hypothetical protein
MGVCEQGEKQMPLKLTLNLVAVAALLTGCSSFNVVQPQDQTIITSPAGTKVAIEGNPRLSGVQVRVDGTDVSNQITAASAARSEGDLSIPTGVHIIDVQADVPCWYCGGGWFHHTAQRKICVVAPGPLTGPSKTPRSNASGNLSWSTAGGAGLSVTADTGTPSTRWNFRRIGGFASYRGIIESVERPCRCLRSMEAASNTPIGMAICDANDPLQQWTSLPGVGYAPGNFRFQNDGRAISDACLTEGAAPQRPLIQRNCNDTPEQVWSLRDNTTGTPASSPWF